jgi:hypothetical protein
MTTMIDRFFGIPQSVVRRGLVKELSPVTLRLLVVLWHESEYHRTRKFVRNTRELMELVGCSRNSLSKARAELAHARLAVIISMGADGFEFHLCDPETGEPWLLPPRVPVPYQRKDPTRSTAPPEAGANFQRVETHLPLPAASSRRAYHREGVRKPVDGKEVNKPATPESTPEPEAPDASFCFGHNAAEEINSASHRQELKLRLSWDDIESGDQEAWSKK